MASKYPARGDDYDYKDDLQEVQPKDQPTQTTMEFIKQHHPSTSNLFKQQEEAEAKADRDQIKEFEYQNYLMEVKKENEIIKRWAEGKLGAHMDKQISRIFKESQTVVQEDGNFTPFSESKPIFRGNFSE